MQGDGFFFTHKKHSRHQTSTNHNKNITNKNQKNGTSEQVPLRVFDPSILKGIRVSVVDAPFYSDYLFRFNFCWTLGLFMSRFKFGPRTYSVSFFILFIESLSRFVFNYWFVLISRIKLCFMSKMSFGVVCVKYCFVSFHIFIACLIIVSY